MKKVVVYCVLGLVALAILGVQTSCTSLRIDYRSVQRWEDPAQDRPSMSEHLRVVLTSPDDLSQIAYSGGLLCRLECLHPYRQAAGDNTRLARPAGSNRLRTTF